MNSVKGVDFSGFILRSVLAVIIVTVGLSLAGCNEQLTRMEDNQLKLEVMIEANAEQIAILAANMEQNQYDLEEQVKNIEKDTRNVAADIASVTDAQMQLKEMVQGNNRTLYNRMSGLEKTQVEMQTSIENVKNDTQTMVAGVNAVSDEQTRLHEIVQNNGSYVADRMDVIEQKQQQWQSMFTGFVDNVQKVVARVNNFEQNLSALQVSVQNGIQDLLSVMNSASGERLQYREQINEKIQTLSESINSILQNQQELRTQVEDLQQTTETMKEEMPEALDYYKQEELSHGGVEPMELEKPVAAFFSPEEINSLPQ